MLLKFIIIKTSISIITIEIDVFYLSQDINVMVFSCANFKCLSHSRSYYSTQSTT